MAFVQLRVEELPNLLKYSERNLPKTARLYNVIKIYLESTDNKCWIPTFYAFDGEIDDDKSTFIVVMILIKDSPESSTMVLTFRPKTTTDLMKQAFEQLIPWTTSTKIFFAEVGEEFVPYLLEKLAKLGKKKAFSVPCFEYYKSIEQGRSIAIESEVRAFNATRDLPIEVKSLSNEDLDVVVKHWSFDDDGEKLENGNGNDNSATRRRYLEISWETKYCPSVGVYLDGKLISWTLTTFPGTFNALHTLEEFRHQGIAQLTVNALTKLSSENDGHGLYTVANALENNLAGQKLFEKLGFTNSGKVVWIDVI